MKFLVFLLLSFNAFAQDSATKELVIEFATQSTKFPTSLDSVIVYNQDDESKELVLSNVPVVSKEIKLNLKNGYYFIIFKAKGFLFRKTNYVAVCSLCENKSHFYFFDDDNKDAILSLLILSPRYEPNYASMKKDFREVLSQKEIKSLNSIENCIITFFVTKKSQLSDITIHSKNISLKNKYAILKGIENLKKWSPSNAGGQKIDGFVKIESKTLLQ